MSIQHRPDRKKPFIARVYGPDGQEHQRSFATEPEAARWERTMLVDRDRDNWSDPRAGDVLLEEWAERWLAGRRRRPSTMRQQEILLRKHVLAEFGSYKLKRIRRSDVLAWRVSLLDSGLSVSTVRQVVLVLRMVLALAVAEGRLAKNPAAGLDPIEDDHEPEHRYLTPQELEALADAIDPSYRALVLVMGLGGLRIGEAASLSPSRVRDGVITVDRTVRADGEFGPPKTRASRRKVAMGVRLSEEMERHRRLYVPTGAALLFPGRSGQTLDHRWFSRRVLAKAVAASIGGHLTPHDLRHTHVSLLIAQGVDLVSISRRLGHGSIRITVDTYGGLQPGTDERVAASLDQAFAGEMRALRVVRGGE